MVVLGIVHSMNDRVRNCRFEEWSRLELLVLGMVVLGMVTLGIVGSRIGRSRNGRVRNGCSRIGCSRIGTSTALVGRVCNYWSF
jgi:hypothetical protein